MSSRRRRAPDPGGERRAYDESCRANDESGRNAARRTMTNKQTRRTKHADRRGLRRYAAIASAMTPPTLRAGTTWDEVVPVASWTASLERRSLQFRYGRRVRQRECVISRLAWLPRCRHSYSRSRRAPCLTTARRSVTVCRNLKSVHTLFRWCARWLSSSHRVCPIRYRKVHDSDSTSRCSSTGFR